MSDELVDLELAGPVAVPDVSVRHRRIRLVPRLHGTPVGAIAVPHDGRDLDASALLERVAERLSEPLWPRLGRPPGAPPPDISISVVVCTRDRGHLLEGCLAALSRQRHRSFETIVVDNAPRTDETRALAKRFGVRYAVEPTAGLDWARNRGFAEARFPIVAYTDDDARPEPGWLEGLARGFASADVQAVTGLVLPAELETPAQLLFEDAYGGMGKGFELRAFTRRGGRVVYRPETYGVGCNMAFRRSWLVAAGGFDRALDAGTATGGGGDLDALQRTIEAGGAIVYRPDAVVRHVHRRSLPALRRQLFDNGRSYSAVLFAALVRARGADRLRVVRRYWQWVAGWHVRRIARRLVGRERLPLRLLLAELAGAPLGPLAYARARLAVRRRARGAPGDAR